MRSIRLIPAGTNLFRKRCAVVPFEAATALLSVWTGIISFFPGLTVSATVVQLTMPPDLVTAFNLIFLVSGAFMLTGIGWNYRNIEAAGIILLASSLLTRLVILLFMVGLQGPVLSAIMQNLTFGLACGARLSFLLKRRSLAVVEAPHDAGD